MGLTVKGSPISAAQVSAADALLAVAKQLQAGAVASEAMIFAAIAESELGGVADTYKLNSAGYWGVLQGAGPGNIGNGGAVYWPDPHDTAGMARAFLLGGKGFNAGGAIALSRSISDPITVAVKVEVPDGGQGYGYSHESGYNGPQWVSEAQAIVGAYGGAALKGGVAGLGGTGTVVNGAAGSTYQFQIGTTSNKDEDVWTGINRLAQEVSWYLFSSGEVLYYLDGEEMIAQQPAVELDRAKDAARIESFQGTFDNTAYAYVSTHRRKFTLQRKTKVQPVISPTQITMSLICGIDEIRAGDVLELSSFGPMDGRWIVGSCRRSVFSVTSDLTLVPPIAPISEAAAAGTTGKKQSATATSSGGAGGKPTGSFGNLQSPFNKRMGDVGLAHVDAGVDFGQGYSNIHPGDPIMAIGDCYCRSTAEFYTGSINPQALWFELVDKSAGYWGWYVAEQINEKVSAGPGLIKAGTVVATYATAGTGIEIGWAAGPGSTDALAHYPGELANRHGGNGTTPGRAFYDFLRKVGAL